MLAFKAAKAAGATETFDYRLPLEARLAEIQRIIEGNFARFIDASSQAYELAINALETVTKREASKKVYFATVDDWSVSYFLCIIVFIPE